MQRQNGLFFRLSCGCLTLVERSSTQSTTGHWLTRTIYKCSDDDLGGYFIRDAVDPVDNNQVGAKHITEGRYLTDDEAEAEVQKLNKLMQDGYRFRQIKDALGA